MRPLRKAKKNKKTKIFRLRIQKLRSLFERLEKLVGKPEDELKANKVPEIEVVLKDIKAHAKEIGRYWRELVEKIDSILSRIENTNLEDISELKELKSLLIALIQFYKRISSLTNNISDRLTSTIPNPSTRYGSLRMHIAERSKDNIPTPDTVRGKIHKYRRISKNLKR